jgi:hypothetical protein
MLKPPCRSLLVLVLVAGLLPGCRDSLPRQKTYPVSGQVLLDSKPVPGATVVFHPVDASTFKWEERPQGNTDNQGRFTLTTYATNDGAPAGEYKVAIAILAQGEDDGSDQHKRVGKSVRIPPNYNSHQKSGLTAKVESRETNLEPFSLKSKP